MDHHTPGLAEYTFGAGQGVERLLTVVVGTGVGAGLLIQGEPVRLTLGGLGDPGFIAISPWGWPAPHGGHGSLEAEAAAPSLPRWFREREIASRRPELREAARKGTLHSEQVIEAAQQGDAAAVWALRQAGGRLGMGLATFSVLFKPEKILIVGGLLTAGEIWWEAVLDSYRYHCPPFYRDGVVVEKGRFGVHAPLVGAAAALFRQTKRD
jgi:glucokinase